MADDAERPLTEVMSLAWSATMLAGASARAKELRGILRAEEYAKLREMRPSPARTRTILAMAVRKEITSMESFLDIVRRGMNEEKSGPEGTLKNQGQWEESVVDALSRNLQTNGVLHSVVDRLSKLDVSKRGKSTTSLEAKYMEHPTEAKCDDLVGTTSSSPMKSASMPTKEFEIRPEYRKLDGLRIQLSSQRPSPSIPVKKSSTSMLPKVTTPKLGAEGRKKLASEAQLASSLKETYTASRKPMMLLEMNDRMDMDPDSLAASRLREEAKKKEKEMLAEKRRKEAEERKRQRELKAKKGKAAAKPKDDPVENGEKPTSEAESASGPKNKRKSPAVSTANEKSGAGSGTSGPQRKSRRKSSSKDDEEDPEETEKKEQEVDVDQMIGPDQNALTASDRKEITAFLQATKNVFEEGQETRSFVLHTTKKESSSPEFTHVIESIVFEITSTGKWRKLRRKKSVRRDDTSNGA